MSETSRNESSRIIDELIRALKDALDQNTNQTVALERVGDALKKIGDNQLTREQWSEIKSLVDSVINRIAGIESVITQSGDAVVSRLDSKFEEIMRRIARADIHDEQQVGAIESLTGEIRLARETFDAVRTDTAERERLRIKSEAEDRRQRRDLWVKLVLGLCTSGGIFYVVVKEFLIG